MKLLLLIVLLAVKTFAIDFTTIGQKEIVDYIKNRADVLYGAKLSERNLQDLLSSAVFTGLEEEASTFIYGESVSSGQEQSMEFNPENILTSLTALVSNSTTESVPLKIFLTSDSQGTTEIKKGFLNIAKSSSSKQSVGDFVVTSVQSENNDITNLDGSITINLGGSTDSHNLTLFKTVYISAEIKITSLGSEWDENLLKNDSKLISLLPSTTGSLYTVDYQSLIRESIPSNDGALFAGTKTSGTVLVHKNANGVLSLAGRIISGKIEPTSEDRSEELVDKFLTLNGAKSRQFFIKDDGMVYKKSNLISDPNMKKSTLSKSNFNCFGGLSRFFDRLFGSRHGHRHGHRHGWKPTTTQAPTTSTSTTPEPKPEPVVTTPKPAFPELSSPKLPPLPKGTTVSVWSTEIIQ
ncbi:uncharacterized protein LOC107365977 [Tetranychus urticae]|uniref:Uncharacterized protein n=1 Tax=Tetranychus urticae TaxID=32264 RepID=T1KNJ2_TETUR|nr:uncharacterized protein LOC107365977 [Tetranychus urticae]